MRQTVRRGTRSLRGQSGEIARERLTAFIKGARKQLLIYDPKVSDNAMLKVLAERVEAGVDVRIIGKVEQVELHGVKVRHAATSGCTSARSSATAARVRRQPEPAQARAREAPRGRRHRHRRNGRRQMRKVFERGLGADRLRQESKRRRRRRPRRRTRRRWRPRPSRGREPRLSRGWRPATAGLDHGVLRASPEVHRRHAMDAADRAVRRARFRRRRTRGGCRRRVGLERHAGIAALLRAVVHEPVFADVEIARAGAAPPLVRLAVGQVVLEVRDARIEILEAPATVR